MNPDYKKELLKSGGRVLPFAAARNIIFAAFPDLVKKYKTKSALNRGVIKNYIDWRSIFFDVRVQMELSKYMQEPVKLKDGFYEGLNTDTNKEARFYLQGEWALLLSFPPEKVKTDRFINIVKIEETDDRKDLLKAYYKL